MFLAGRLDGLLFGFLLLSSKLRLQISCWLFKRLKSSLGTGIEQLAAVYLN